MNLVDSMSKISCWPVKGEEEEVHNPKMIQEQGIVSILGYEGEKTKAASLRRTLSADMSSKKWLAQNGLSSPMKKIASSQQIAISTLDSSEEEDDEEEYDVAKRNKPSLENPSQSDIWSSILSQKAGEASSALPPPYVHPLVKRSTSLLSEKSLEICTESLGSETGSDVFSSSSETGDEDKEEEDEQHGKESEFIEKNEEFEVVKYTHSHSTTKKVTKTRSFPPPLPSLARSDGPSLHMHSHRKDGRLVLEAVSVPSENYFQAQRHDGRLLLTLINAPPEEEKVVDVFDISEKQDQEQEREEEEEERDENIDNRDKEDQVGIFFMEEQAPKVVDRSTLMMKKIVERDNRINPTWPHHKYFNNKKSVLVNLTKLEVVEEEELDPTTQHGLTQSLPPPPPPPRAVAAATSFNTYQYFWRAKPTMASVINNPVMTLQSQELPLKNSFNKMYEQKELVVMRGNKADCLVPALRGCQEPRRSLLIWEPHCIATS